MDSELSYMEPNRDISFIKKEILQALSEMEVTVKDIILFGSRARKEYTKYSDYDFLIIVDKSYSFKEKMRIRKKINQVLAKLLIPSDIIINSEEEIKHKKDRIGCITRYAIREGNKI